MSSSLALKYSCLTLSGRPHSLATVKRVATCTAAAPFSRKPTASLPVKMPPAAISGNVKLFGFQIRPRFQPRWCARSYLRPVHAKAQVAAGQRAFDHDEIRQAVEAGGLAQEQLQRPHRRDDDAQLGIAKARVVVHQAERAQVQAGAQGDAVNAGIQRRMQAHVAAFRAARSWSAFPCS